MLYSHRMSIGARLRQIRNQQKLSQDQIGEICEVSKGMVSQWESDTVTPPTDRIIKLQKQLNFSVDWLLFGDTPAEDRMRGKLRDLLKVAQNLPDYAVEKLTKEGGNYAEIIAEAKAENKTRNGQ